MYQARSDSSFGATMQFGKSGHWQARIEPSKQLGLLFGGPAAAGYQWARRFVTLYSANTCGCRTARHVMLKWIADSERTELTVMAQVLLGVNLRDGGPEATAYALPSMSAHEREC